MHIGNILNILRIIISKLGPFIAPLKEILRKEYNVTNLLQDIEIQTLFKALYNINFLTQIPLVNLCVLYIYNL